MNITLTESAAKHIRGFMSADTNPACLRVGVRTTGCSGYMYVVEIAEEKNEHDEVFESRGINLLVDKESFKYLQGTEIDFTKEGLNEGFRFNNPNVSATCGCGESFSI
jgi:iron-sulfur cluster assembly protein